MQISRSRPSRAMRSTGCDAHAPLPASEARIRPALAGVRIPRVDPPLGGAHLGAQVGAGIQVRRISVAIVTNGHDGSMVRTRAEEGP